MASTGIPTRILIVSIHPHYRAGLARLIDAQAELELIDTVDDTNRGLHIAQNANPDIVILDTARTRHDGLEFLRDPSAREIGSRFLFLATDDDPLYAERALNAGAHGYLLKHTASHNLVTAIRALTAGRRYIDPTIER